MENEEKRLQELTALCKQRGFVFPSSEIYGGLRSAYDYGPLGVELKRNIMNEWWNDTVYARDNVVGLDASIIMHTDVWKASGHLEGFSDPLVDCKVCKERFRADKAPTTKEGEDLVISFPDKGKAKAALTYIKETFDIELERDKKNLLGSKADNRGYKCPICGCGGQFLSEERQFNLMFRSFLGAIDPLEEIAQKIEQGKMENLSGKELRDAIQTTIDPATVYLRPETAQAMFVQFQNVQRTMSLKVPFGIAQIGKSFRNEITTRYFIFRSCEFEQMEMEFFCKPDTAKEWLDYWKDTRLNWWQKYANTPENFKLRQHEEDELAHYADNCYDIEYNFPWGWDELEGVASRTDYDLKKHEAASGKKLQYRDPITNESYHPYVIEPAAGATRGVLAFLNDALSYDEIPDSKGVLQKRTVMRLHPRLAPYKVAILPLLSKEGMPEKARKVAQMFFEAGINARYDEANAIGKRYRRHDEIGTPYCLTVDGETLENDTVTIRDRDTTKQERISIQEAVAIVKEKLEK